MKSFPEISLKQARDLIVAVLSALLLMSGCSVLKVPGPPPQLYNLTPKSTFSSDLPTINSQLIIEEPTAAGGLESNRIALRPRPTRLQYFADVRWTERAPKMVQTLLIESFENTSRIIAVGRESIGLRSDYTLKTELREFQAENDSQTGKTSVRVRINAKIVQQSKWIIIGSQSFERVVEVDPAGGMNAIVSAFDSATGKVIKRLVEWTIVTVEQTIRKTQK